MILDESERNSNSLYPWTQITIFYLQFLKTIFNFGAIQLTKIIIYILTILV